MFSWSTIDHVDGAFLNVPAILVCVFSLTEILGFMVLYNIHVFCLLDFLAQEGGGGTVKGCL